MSEQKKPNILLIDDEELTQELMRHMLRELHCNEVDIHSSCSKALTRLKKSPNYFDLIISDWEVPGLNGLDFLKEVRQLEPDIPFLMVTGNSGRDLVIKAVQAGVTDFLAKPFTANGLLGKVQKLTGTTLIADDKK